MSEKVSAAEQQNANKAASVDTTTATSTAAPKTTPTPPLAATATNQPVSPQTTHFESCPCCSRHEFVEGVRWEGLK